MSYDHPRQFVRVEQSIDFDYSVEDSPFRARLTDLSEGGAFVDTQYPQEVGEEIVYRFQLPDGSEEVSGRARVVWQQPMLGMGIRFLDLSDGDRERLRFFVASVYFEFGLEPPAD